MLIVRDENGKIRCAKCYCQLGKKDVVSDRFLPKSCSSGVSTAVNMIGVCPKCHTLRNKNKFVLPTYWKHLSNEQKDNLRKYMRNARSSILLEVEDESLIKAVKAL